MHELGIVFNIIDSVDKIAIEKNVDSVKKVILEVGEVSSVIPRYVEDCWKWAVENRSQRMKGCELKIIVLKALSYCQDCEETYPTLPSGRKCPKCGGNHTYLITGNETQIQSIEVADPPSDK
ncbi:MAG: hydrogenase maturation nickel metallochaperone HypA [Bacilli bacterium]|nr:hydrogenase maturation nickel metallochaperone HypA [Bacilli bacterium]